MLTWKPIPFNEYSTLFGNNFQVRGRESVRNWIMLHLYATWLPTWDEWWEESACRVVIIIVVDDNHIADSVQNIYFNEQENCTCEYMEIYTSQEGISCRSNEIVI